MPINMQKVMSELSRGESIKTLAKKYNMSEEQLNEAIQKELLYSSSKQNSSYQQQLAEHNKKVNDEYSRAYEKLKSGQYMDALKSGLNATIAMFNPPQNPNLITGVAPCPMKWADIKSIFSLLKSLKNLPHIISNLKKCKTIQQFKNFITKLAQDLKLVKAKGNATKPKAETKIKQSLNTKTQAQLIKEYSNGKNLTDMTDEELVVYYKKLIPDINKEELKCLIDQVHRIKKGEPRWLNTEEENNILRSINDKLRKQQAKLGINEQKFSEVDNSTADIPFKKKELTDFQFAQLRRWRDDAVQPAAKALIDEVGTVLDQDVYLYRCVTVRAEGSLSSQKNNVSFLNSIKEGGIINNGDNCTSTAQNINHVYDNSTSYGHSYILKIRVPKGTKVLDMRNYKSRIDEIVLPPCSYKVNKIDYTTGVVDCDFIPN